MSEPKERGRTWSPELETALLRALRTEVASANHDLFRGRLRPAALRLTETDVLGRWISEERTIELSRPLVLERPWGEVVEVLRHELAHQFVEEVQEVRDEPPHGPTFRRVCAQLGIDARAAGHPSAAESDPATARVIEKVRRLFALAGSENQNEAELAMRRAQEIMLKHELSLDATERRYVFRQLGTPGFRKSRAESIVGGLLGAHFFVEVIWSYVYVPHAGRHARALEACGTPENVAMAEYVHEFLLRTAERLWNEARARQPGLRPGDRSAFMAGVVCGFRDKLDEAGRSRRGTGLVWVGDPGLERYFRRRNPRVRTARRGVTSRFSAQQLGRVEGRKVVLHRPIEGGASNAGTRLLRG